MNRSAFSPLNPVNLLRRQASVGWLALFVAAVALVSSLGGKLHADAEQNVLKVRRLIIVDEKGTERIVLGSPVGDVVVGGQPHKRRSPQTGMIINDATGNERSGYGLSDDGVVHLGMDSEAGRERVSLLFWPGVGSGLLVRGEKGKQRAAFGITSAKGDSGAVLNDAAGSIRIHMKVPSEGDPILMMRDAEGQPVLALPNLLKEQKR